jgi:hypothetical protein
MKPSFTKASYFAEATKDKMDGTAGNRNDSESIFATKEPKERRYQ